MNDKKIIKDNAAINGDLVCYFKNENNSKKYCYYIMGEQNDGSPTVKVHVAVVKQSDEALNAPISDDEWAFLKGIMGNVVQGKASEGVKYLIPQSDLEVANEKVIAMPISYDYVNKHKAEYDASKVADEVIAPSEPVQASAAPETPPASEPAAPAAPAPAQETPSAPAPNLFDQALNPENASAAPVPETNLFDQAPAAAPAPAAEPVMAPPAPSAPDALSPQTPGAEVSGFAPVMPEPDKDIPKVPDTNSVNPAGANTFSNIIPNPSDIANEPIIEEPQKTSEPANSLPSNLNIDEIKAKCTEMINAINAFTEELSKLTSNLENTTQTLGSPEPVISSVEPVAITPAPVESVVQSAQGAQQAAAPNSFDTNWFDAPQN